MTLVTINVNLNNQLYLQELNIEQSILGLVIEQLDLESFKLDDEFLMFSSLS